MSSTHPEVRHYDNSRRAERAAATRRTVLEATRRIVVESGYSGVTVRAVAREAAVSLATVYRGFGSRRELVREALGTAREHRPEPSLGEPATPAVDGARTGAEILTQVAADTRRIFDEVGRASAVLLVAARAGESELRDLAAEAGARRLAGTSRVAHAIAGDLRADIDESRAADILWSLTSPEVNLQLTEDRGWSAEEYEHWLATTLVRALLPAPRLSED